MFRELPLALRGMDKLIFWVILRDSSVMSHKLFSLIISHNSWLVSPCSQKLTCVYCSNDQFWDSEEWTYHLFSKYYSNWIGLEIRPTRREKILSAYLERLFLNEKKSLLNAPRPFDFSLLLAGWPIFWIMNFVYLCWPITGYHMVEPPPWRWIQQTFFHHQTSFPNKLTIVLNISQCETHIFRVKLTVQRLDLEVHVHRRNPASVIFLYIKRWRMVIVIVHGSLIWRKVHDLPQAIVKLSMS